MRCAVDRLAARLCDCALARVLPMRLFFGRQLFFALCQLLFALALRGQNAIHARLLALATLGVVRHVNRCVVALFQRKLLARVRQVAMELLAL